MAKLSDQVQEMQSHLIQNLIHFDGMINVKPKVEVYIGSTSVRIPILVLSDF